MERRTNHGAAALLFGALLMAGVWCDEFGWYQTSQIARVMFDHDGGVVGSGELAYSVSYVHYGFVQTPHASGARAIFEGNFFNDTAPPIENIIQGFLLGSAYQVSFKWKPDRTVTCYRGGVGGTLLGTSSEVIPLSTEIRFVFDVTIGGGTSGSAYCSYWLDGVETVVLSLTGINTQALGSATWDGFDHEAASDGETKWKHVVVMDGSGSHWNAPLGRGGRAIVKRYRPAGPGAINGWAPNSGTNHAERVDEQTADDDTSYLSTASIGAQELFDFEDVPLTDDIAFVTLVGTGKLQSGSGTNHVSPAVRQSATTTIGSARTTPGSYGLAIKQPYQTAPDGTLFTPNVINGLQWGMERTGSAGTVRMTQLALLVVTFEAEDDDEEEPPDDGSCSGGDVPQLADPLPGVTFSGLGPHEDRVFVEIDLDGGMVSVALHDPMRDSPALLLHPGNKPGRLLSVSSIVRRTTDRLGSWQSSTANFVLDDGDRYVRGLIDAGLWYNREARIYVAKRTDVPNARCLFRGIIREFPPGTQGDGMTVDVELIDIIATEFSPFYLDKDLLASAVYDSARVPGAPRELLDQNPKKPMPVYMGLWSDEASDVDPPVLIGNPAIGSRIDGGVWIMGYGNLTSGPAAPAGLAAVVGSGGSINAADLPYGTLYAQVWAVDGSGNPGDPYPFLPTGLPITVTGTNQKVTLTVTPSGGPTPDKYRFALATKYYGARWLQILEVDGGTTSVEFTAHPVFGGGSGFSGSITPGAFAPIVERRWYRLVAIVDGARTAPSDECMAYENTPYYRPIHVTCLPVTDADSYEVYAIDWAPMQPVAAYNRKWDVPVQIDGDGFQYFEDLFDDDGVSFVAGVTAPSGLLPVDDTGDESISGVPYGRLCCSRWAMRRIIGVYAGGQRLADDHPDLLHPDHAAWPFADRTRLLGDVDCTVIYAKGQILAAHRDGSAKVTFNACTTEHIGDGRGDGINQSARAEQHLDTELALNDHKVGLFDGVPLFADGTPMIKTSSYAAIEQLQIGRVGGSGYPEKAALLKPITLRSRLQASYQSFGIARAISAHGAVMVGHYDAPITDPDATVHLLDVRQIVGRIKVTPQTDALENQIPYESGYRPVSDDFSNQDAFIPTMDDVATDPAVIDNRNKVKLGSKRSLPYAGDETAVADVMDRAIVMGRYVRDWVEVPASIEGLSIDLFDVLRITDEEGIGAQGYEGMFLRVLEHEVVPPDPSQDRPLTTVLRGLNVTPFAEVVS